MSNKNLTIAVIVIGIISIIGLFQPVVSKPFGASQNYTNYNNLALQDYGTTTLKILGGSTTTGACVQFNATSSATVLNMTFSATTTAVTVNAFPSGVIPTIGYGACN